MMMYFWIKNSLSSSKLWTHKQSSLCLTMKGKEWRSNKTTRSNLKVLHPAPPRTPLKNQNFRKLPAKKPWEQESIKKAEWKSDNSMNFWRKGVILNLSSSNDKLNCFNSSERAALGKSIKASTCPVLWQSRITLKLENTKISRTF